MNIYNVLSKIQCFVLSKKSPMLDLSNFLKFQIRSYRGTGNFGINNLCTLNFDFAPIMIILAGVKEERVDTGASGVNYGSYTHYNHFYGNESKIFMQFITTNYPDHNQNFGYAGYNRVKKSTDGKTIYWYSTQSADDQYNKYTYDSNTGLYYYYTYYWLGIG